MRAEVVSIGTELLLGEIVDTNSAWVSQSLADLGFDVYWSSRVGDNLERAVEALRGALARSDVVVTSGGLGSTDDDLTRAAVAQVAGEVPTVDAAMAEHLRDWFRRANYTFQDIMLYQASRIPSAEFLPNRVGTAPGWFVRLARAEASEKFIVTLPGPPRELQAMWTEQAVPRLPRPGGHLLRHTVKVFGIGEGRVFEMLGDLVKPSNPSVATYAKTDGVHVRVAAGAAELEHAERMLAPALARVRKILGTTIWGENDDTMVGRIAAMLRARGSRLSTIESITGGVIAREITDVAGVSDVFTGGAVAYDPAIKIKLGVPAEIIEAHGVVSQETAEAMAEACARWFGTDYAIATTGVAGPSDLEGKPAGTVHIAVRTRAGVTWRVHSFASRSRQQVQERAAYAALGLLWTVLSAG